VLCALARKRLGWSQNTLSQVLGVSWVTISRWECGRLSPSAYTHTLLQCFAEAAKRRPAIGEVAARVLAERGAIAALYELLRACYGDKR
jgi:DNA-binding XRE family transcriptional regulator